MTRDQPEQLVEQLLFKGSTLTVSKNFNGLMLCSRMCLNKQRYDFFIRAYNYAMNYQFSAHEQNNITRRYDKSSLSMQLLLQAAVEQSAIFHVIYTY